MNKPYDCYSYDAAYAVICKKERGKKAYLGKTKIMLKFSLWGHCQESTSGEARAGDTWKWE